MVKFGETIVAHKQNSNNEWAKYYLDYEILKNLLEDGLPQKKHPQLRPPPGDHPPPPQQIDTMSVASMDTSTRLLFPHGVHDVTVEFLTQLQSQVESMVLFVLQEQGKLATQLMTCKAALTSYHEATTDLGVPSPPIQYPPPPPHPMKRDSLDSETLDGGSVALSTTHQYSNTEEMFRDLEERLCDIGMQLLKLYQFIDLNVTGIRKILKKHDKLFPRNKISTVWLTPSNSSITDGSSGNSSNAITLSPRLHRHTRSGWLAPLRQRSAVSYGKELMQPLLRDECLGALTSTLEVALQELYSCRASQNPWSPMQDDSWNKRPIKPQRAHHRATKSLTPLIESLKIDTNGIDPLSGNLPTMGKIRRTSLTIGDMVPLRDSAIGHHHRQHGMIHSAQITERKSFRFNLGARSKSLILGEKETQRMVNADTILWQIQSARRRLHETSNLAHLLAAPLMMEVSDGTPSDDGMDEDESLVVEEEDDNEAIVDLQDVQEAEDQLRRATNISSLLNLLSTMLYMCNYYIVAPTSADYAEKLGGTPSMSSMIIGMTPVAALVSTVLYSWWTSYSYKSALMFASACSVLGNLLYAAGLPFNSLTLVMIGRLLNGFGSARSINRRYICDTYPREERTVASAAFVTAGALGMAAGPAIASVLHYITTDQDGNDWNDSIYFQAENASGWFMFGTWSVYFVCLVIYFQDPPKKKEAMLMKKDVSSLALNGEETNHLLGNGKAEHEEESVKEPPIWRNVPVMMTFSLYFVLKLVLEGVLSATAVLTGFYFGWHSGLVGLYLAALGLLMLPANICVAVLARSYDDRELMMGMQLLMFLGCVGILQYTNVYPVAQYIVASIVLFISTNALEGPNMSLLSKTIPPSWSKGIFNVGLLSTEAGTLGRAIGDVLLTAFGSDGLEHLLNRTFGSFSILSLTTLLLSYKFYDLLEPTERDD